VAAHAGPTLGASVSGYSGKPLAQKLGIRAGSRLYLHAAPQNYAQLLAPLPQGARTVARLDEDTDIIHVFALRRVELAKALRAALAGMRPDAALWVSWPKQASGVATDITEDVIRTLALPLSLVDVKVCAVDEVWSALKLVIRKAARATSGARAVTRQKRSK
jgi:hypothetical protein